jgi:hypothetical protein
MKIISVLFFLFSVIPFARAISDTINLYRVDELVWHSELESRAFECLKTDDSSCNRMMMALATDASITFDKMQEYQKEFYIFLEEIKTDKKFAAKPKAQVKFIFKSIHKKYFELYQANPLFSEIFTTGSFNCVSASVLFALAFDYYQIPYQIILLPNHVYLLAYPGSASVVVETTNPMKGAHISISMKEMAESVNELINMKLVTDAEVKSKGVEKVFTEVFLARETPDLTELIGALYFNLGHDAAQKMNFLDAYELFKKSSVLHPRLLTTALILDYAAVVITRPRFDKPDTYRVLGEMEKFISYNFPSQFLIDQANNFIQEAKRFGQNPLMDSAYVWLQKSFTNSYIRDEITYVYHYNKALDLYRDLRRADALKNLEIAYNIKPHDSDINLLLVDVLWSNLVVNQSIDESYRLIQSFSERFETLNQSNRFRIIHQMVLLHMMNHNIVQLNYTQAEKFRKEFEQKFAPENVDAVETLILLEEFYSRASLYYFRANRNSNARAVLTSGLKYIPESYELQSKMRALK